MTDGEWRLFRLEPDSYQQLVQCQVSSSSSLLSHLPLSCLHSVPRARVAVEVYFTGPGPGVCVWSHLCNLTFRCLSNISQLTNRRNYFMTRQLPDADLIISLPGAARPGLVYNVGNLNKDDLLTRS